MWVAVGDRSFLWGSSRMFYRLKRHVIYSPRAAENLEVWGIDRRPAALEVSGAPRDTDRDDPLGTSCPLLLVQEGSYVTWDRFFEWLSYAEGQGYTLVTPFADLTPYSVRVLKGP